MSEEQALPLFYPFETFDSEQYKSICEKIMLCKAPKITMMSATPMRLSEEDMIALINLLGLTDPNN